MASNSFTAGPDDRDPIASRGIHHRLATLLMLVLAVRGLAGCARDADPVNVRHGDVAPQATTAAATLRAESAPALTPEIERWLARLKTATAAFHDTTNAFKAGWKDRITDCMAMPDSGGMGFHYARTGLIDGMPQDTAPELLVYAPRAGGGLQLVAVEYIVPFTFVPPTGKPPALHGVKFHQNVAFGLWVLHAWVWENNPVGVFRDWNPHISCTPGR